MDELDVGMYKILEPKAELRSVSRKRLQPEDLDLVMVPGVAFDRQGGRTGHGKGYYDKLLEHARANAPLIALAFECQMFPEIPCGSHDIYMDKVVTELTVYPGRGRQWPPGFFESIRIDDPAFERPTQGPVPAVPSFDE
jgi:5-formyltetrahydrofolate cyclo-ligase